MTTRQPQATLHYEDNKIGKFRRVVGKMTSRNHKMWLQASLHYEDNNFGLSRQVVGKFTLLPHKV